MFDGMPRGDDLLLHSLGNLLNSRVQNLDDLCVRRHMCSGGRRPLSHPTENHRG